MSAVGGEGSEQAPSEAELRAAYEEEIKRIRVEHVLLDHTVTLINLGMRRTGLSPGTESERDPGQVRLAIEAIRALLPMVETVAGDQAAALRDALSQLQLAYVRIGGQAHDPAAAGSRETSSSSSPVAGQAASEAGASAPPPPGARGSESPPAEGDEGPGPAQRSGRLWIPGQ